MLIAVDARTGYWRVGTGPVRRVKQVNTTKILKHPWPEDLDPETVVFATRTETVLRRHGFYDDPNLFNTLTVEQVAVVGTQDQ